MTPVPGQIWTLAIDPGNVESAYFNLKGDGSFGSFGKVPNAQLIETVRATTNPNIAIEMIMSYGMPAGASLFDTCVFIGEIIREAYYNLNRPKVTLMGRMQVKSHICHDGRAKDANIRAALLDLFGPQGTKKAPGPTYGISADVWSALAIAETFRSGDFTPYILSQDKT